MGKEGEEGKRRRRERTGEGRRRGRGEYQRKVGESVSVMTSPERNQRYRKRPSICSLLQEALLSSPPLLHLYLILDTMKTSKLSHQRNGTTFNHSRINWACVSTHRMAIIVSSSALLSFLFHSGRSKGRRQHTYLLKCLFENNMQKEKNNPQLTTAFLAICLI